MNIAEWIEKLAPFGQANPEPKFVAHHEVIDDVSTAGLSQQHLKLRFGNYWALAFGQAEDYSDLRPGQLVDLVYNLGINRYNNHAELQLKIIDLRRINN